MIIFFKQAIAPPHSYIDVNDFNSVEELSQYLVKLSKDKEEYNKYFEWKENYNLYLYMSYCELCEKLNQPEIPTKTIENGYDWWYKRKNGQWACSDGSERTYNKKFS